MKRNLFLKMTMLAMVMALLAGRVSATQPTMPNHFSCTWDVSPLPEKSGPVTVTVDFSPVEKCLGAADFRLIPQGSGGLEYSGPAAIVIEGTGAKSYRAEIPVIVPEGDTCSVGILLMADGCQAKLRVLFWPSDSGVQCGRNLPRGPKPPHPNDVIRASMTAEQLAVEKYVAVPYQWLVPSVREYLERLLGPSNPPMGPDSLYQNRTTVDILMDLDKLGIGFRDVRPVTPPPTDTSGTHNSLQGSIESAYPPDPAYPKGRPFPDDGSVVFSSLTSEQRDSLQIAKMRELEQTPLTDSAWERITGGGVKWSRRIASGSIRGHAHQGLIRRCRHESPHGGRRHHGVQVQLLPWRRP